MKKRNLALIYGGSSTEHNASLKSFEWVYKQIQNKGLGDELSLKYVIFVNREGNAVITKVDSDNSFKVYSQATEFVSLAEIMAQIKKENVFIFSCLHGKNGEDGRIQGMADVLKIEGAFGEFLSCAISMNKYHMNNYVHDRFSRLTVPQTINVYSVSNLKKQLKTVAGKSIVVKPASLGASIFTEKFDYDGENIGDISSLISKILEYDEKALVQEYASGIEYSCGCIEKDGNVEVLPLVRIDTKGGFFGHKEKHIIGVAQEVLIDEKDEEKIHKEMKKQAREIFMDMGFQNDCRFDFIVNKDTIYFLEANALPGLMENSIFPKMLRKAGLNVVELVKHSYHNALNRSDKNTNLEYKID